MTTVAPLIISQGLQTTLGKSRLTVQKVASNLVDAKILKEVYNGRSRIIRVDEKSPYAEALFNLFDSTKRIGKKKRITGLNREDPREFLPKAFELNLAINYWYDW